MKQLTIKLLALICVLCATTIVGAQTNLLLNGKADSKTEHWYVGETTVEEFNGDKVFVLRKGGHLSQWVELTEEAVGKYVLFIGRVSSERANVDGKPPINSPYFYIFNSNPTAVSEGRIIRDEAKGENEWFTIYAIYQLPKESFIKCVLYERKNLNVPSEALALRFDNLGLYLFETEEDALKFAKAYK
jgi:hypothetical protein